MTHWSVEITFPAADRETAETIRGVIGQTVSDQWLVEGFVSVSPLVEVDEPDAELTPPDLSDSLE